MLGKTDPQASFFDSYIEEYFLPQEHELLKIKENVDRMCATYSISCSPSEVEKIMTEELKTSASIFNVLRIYRRVQGLQYVANPLLE